MNSMTHSNNAVEPQSPKKPPFIPTDTVPVQVGRLHTRTASGQTTRLARYLSVVERCRFV